MRSYKSKLIFTILFFCILQKGVAQTSVKDTALSNATEQSPKLVLITYARVIADANGDKRMDENILTNFRVCNWLRLEAGFRQGQRPELLDAYYHYKLELQTKLFWKAIRVVARISDNVITIPKSSYRKTNKLFAVETRKSLSSLFSINAGLGYVFSSKENNVTDARPTSKGLQSNYPIFKVGIRYKASKKNFTELLYGSYDVFNPYYYTSPFLQLSTEQELSERFALFSYFRYQYHTVLFTPNTYFLALGLRFHPAHKK